MAWVIFKQSLNIFNIPGNYVAEFLKLKIGINDIMVIPTVLIILFIVDLMQEKVHVRTFLENRNFVIRWAVYLIGFIMLVGLGMYGPGFDQNQFTYVQF